MQVKIVCPLCAKIVHIDFDGAIKNRVEIPCSACVRRVHASQMFDWDELYEREEVK